MWARIMEWLLIGSWLVSMAVLTTRDALPRWFAEPPPAPASELWLRENGREFQYGIYGANEVLCGNGWTVYEGRGEVIMRTDVLVLNQVEMINTLFITSEMTFLNETELDRVDLRMAGMPAAIRLMGERQGPKFAFSLEVGNYPKQEFVLEAEAAQTLSDIIKPFSTLRNLEVGKSWKIHVIDPLSLIKGGKGKLKALVAEVTGRERIQVQGRAVECFVVECSGSRAWVDLNGRVWRQESELPGLGRLVIVDQPFQEEKLEQAYLRMNRDRHREREHH
ncbi:MAG: hypothetical protein HJJLKODD_00837 [Phycisphaerae bacterium]|nr:hypothetical protein [Phycisphaerae bacterium]